MSIQQPLIYSNPLNTVLPEISQEEKDKSLVEAVKRGDLQAAESLIDQGANPAPTKLYRGDSQHSFYHEKTPLSIAILQENIGMIALLIKKGVDLDSGEFMSPLFLATSNGKISAARFLIENGANVNIRISHADRERPLFEAVNRGNLEMVTLLLEKKAWPNIRGSHPYDDKKFGDSPLNIAISLQSRWSKGATDPGGNYFKIMKLLVENKANLKLEGYEGDTPLARAAAKGNIQAARFLIENGAEVNNASFYGSPLYRAVSEVASIEMVEFLVKNGADIKSPRPDISGDVLLHAIATGHVKIAAFLIQSGAHLYKEKKGYAVNCPSTYRVNTHLASSVEHGYPQITKLLLEKGAIYCVEQPSENLNAFNKLLIKTSETKNEDNERHDIIELIKRCLFYKKKSIEPSLRVVQRAIEKEEQKVLTPELVGNHKGLSDLLKKKTQIKRLIAKAKRDYDTEEIKKQKSALKKLEKPAFDDMGRRVGDRISDLQKPVEKAKELIKEGRIQEAKAELEGFDFGEKLKHDAVVCSFLIGMWVEDSTNPADIETIVDALVNKVDLGDLYKNRDVFLLIKNLSDVNELSSNEKIILFRRVVESHKKDLLKAISMLQALITLKGIATLKNILMTEESAISLFKKAFADLFESRFNLEGEENLQEKYERTFGGFRDREAILIYLASLNSHSDPEYANKMKGLLSIYVKDVLNDRFKTERYNLENSCHLKKVFGQKPWLLNDWKKCEVFPIENFMESLVTAPSKIDYMKIFREKIVDDNHLGDGWKEKYYYLELHISRRSPLFQKDMDRIALQIKSHGKDSDKGRILDAQLTLLTLCREENLSREAQVALLQQASVAFAGTEFQNDLKVFFREPSSAKARDTSEYTVCDTDDPCDILLMGNEIQGSCQRLGGNPKVNAGLLGPLLDGKYRVIAIKNGLGRLVARCLLKILWDAENQTPVLFQERIYAFNEPNNSEHHSELLTAMCKKKAKAMGIPLLRRADTSSNWYPKEVQSLGGRSSVEYVDALKGIQGNTYTLRRSEVVWQPEMSPK